MISKIILAMALLTPFVSLAKPKAPAAKKAVVVKKPASDPTIQVRTVYGEKISLFTITRKGNHAVIDFANNSGSRSTKQIAVRDYVYLEQRVAKIVGTNNDKKLCSRNYTTITSQKKQVLGCIGSPNAVAKEVQETVNLLTVAM